MKSLAFASITLVASVASAEPRHVLVLRSDGNADAATHAKVDAEILKLAHNLDGTVEAGEIDLADATAAVGCNPSEAGCRDDVMATMSVDELVTTTVTSGAGGEIDVSVRRLIKGSPTRDAALAVPAGQPLEARIESVIGPLFGVAATTAAPGESQPTTPATPTTPTTPAAPATPTTPVGPASPSGDNGQPPLTGLQPTAEDDDVSYTRRRHVEIGVIAAGGTASLLGMLFWAAASGTDNDIRNAPTKTPADFKNLTDLENKGDTQATVGNIFVVSGLAAAAIGGYFFWRDHHDHDARHASITPVLFDHGGGIAVTLGGLR